MRFRIPALRMLLAVLFLAWVLPVRADTPTAPKKAEVKKPAASSFIRLTRDAKEQPLTLETATVRYVPASGEGGLEVDLIAVVHVGDAAYYDKLNKQLQQYDVLLYELVAPQGTRIPKGGKRKMDNPIAMLQQVTKILLGLESQTEHIDYTQKNFVHADLSPEQIAEKIRKRGDDGLTLFLSVAADLLRERNLREMAKDKKEEKDKKGEEVDPLSLLGDPDAPIKLKKLLAEQLVEQASPEGSLGKTIHTILVTDRNEACMKVFQKQLASGKKKIGIFFGAAHMPDFEKRLREDFGLKRSSEKWLTAWDLNKKKSDAENLQQLFKLLDSLKD